MIMIAIVDFFVNFYERISGVSGLLSVGVFLMSKSDKKNQVYNIQ